MDDRAQKTTGKPSGNIRPYNECHPQSTGIPIAYS
jgi:hypothetical protein